MPNRIIAVLGSLLAAQVSLAQDSIPATPIQPAPTPAPAVDESPRPAPMTIGSPAPTPEIAEFVRGKEPKWFEPGKTYVVEFWATWCGPCRVSMPHISDLAEKYGDKVVVVGVSDEKLDTVRTFLDKDEWKQKARYTLATDPDRSTHKQYMEAAGQDGIPTAFIVKDSTVQWIGHPMTMDEPLDRVVAGTWDPTEFKKEFDAAAEMARKQMQQRRAMAEARKKGDWGAIVKMMDETIAAAPEGQKAGLRMNKFMMLLTDAKMPKEGYELGREIFAASKDNPMMLNQLAWFVLDDGRVKDRDIPFALEVAKQAVTASKAEDGAILDTLARAYWESGDKAKAIEWQKKAVESADEEAAEELRDTLRKYESGDAPTKKTALRIDDAPAEPKGDAPAAPKGDAPAAPKGDAPAPRCPRGPRGPSAPAKLSSAAEKVFPPIKHEGFKTTDELLAFLPTASADAEGTMRLVRAMRTGSDSSEVSLRVAAALIEDMRPMAEASVEKFGKAGSSPIPVPGAGLTFDLTMEGEDAAVVTARDGKGVPAGQPIALVRADEAWWIDFEKGAGMRAGEGAQMAMMANMMGDSMRAAIKTAAGGTAKRVLAGEFTSVEEANAAFSQAMQMEMMNMMGGMGGPGGPGGPGAPAGPGGRGLPAGPGGAGAPPAAPKP